MLLVSKLLYHKKLRKVVSHYFRFLRIIRSAVSAYKREMSYFLRAKWSLSHEVENKALLLRKRAHFAERVLITPDAYTLEIAERVTKELDVQIRKADGEAPTSQIEWAKKILNELRKSSGSRSKCAKLDTCTKSAPPTMSTDSLMKLIKNRRSRRVFTQVPLSQAERLLITEAALNVPSCCNRQPLELIFVEERGLKSLIADTIPGGRQFFYNAPCILILIADGRDYNYPEDRVNPYAEAGAAIQNIYLLCETIGLGCCWGSYNSFGSVRSEYKVRQKLKIPESYIIVGSVALGRSTQSICSIPRNPIQSCYHIDYWSCKS